MSYSIKNNGRGHIPPSISLAGICILEKEALLLNDLRIQNLYLRVAFQGIGI